MHSEIPSLFLVIDCTNREFSKLAGNIQGEEMLSNFI